MAVNFVYSLKTKQQFWSCKMYSSSFNMFYIIISSCEDIYGHYYCVQKNKFISKISHYCF